MGFFSKQNDGTSVAGLAPLTRERIKAALESRTWSYKVDSDGDIAGAWEDGVFWFLITGEQKEILYVRGVWDGRLSPDDLAGAERVCAEWNRDKYWPKVYPRITDEGKLLFNTEHIVDYEFGVSDDQLLLHIRGAVGTGCQFFEHLNEVYPAAAAAAKETQQ